MIMKKIIDSFGYPCGRTRSSPRNGILRQRVDPAQSGCPVHHLRRYSDCLHARQIGVAQPVKERLKNLPIAA